MTVGALARDLLDEFTGEWDFETKAHKAAFSVVADNGSMHPLKEREFIRLVKIAALGRTDVIAEYIVLFRLALARYDADTSDPAPLLSNLKEILQPLVAQDPDLHTYVEGLPSRYEVAKRTKTETKIHA